SAEADPRGRDDDVGRALDELARPCDERLVVDVRDDREGRRVLHLCAVALERRRELARPAIDGDHDDAPGERRRQQGTRGFAHGPARPRVAVGVRSSRSGRATSPTTITAGLETPTARASSTARPRVVRVVRCRGVWPLSTIATGRFSGTPASRAACTRRGSAATPMSTTVVASGSASAASVAGETAACPFTTCTEPAVPRC